MKEADISSTGLEQTLARSRIYKSLSKSFLYPTEVFFKSLQSGEFMGELRESAEALPGSEKLQKAIKDLEKALCVSLGKKGFLDFQVEFNRLFSSSRYVNCPPYETEYGNTVFTQMQDMADIAGFYRAFGLEVSEKVKERVDHISLELEFLHFLAVKEVYCMEQEDGAGMEVTIETEKKFLQSHLGKWVGMFCRNLKYASNKIEFYRLLGKVTKRFVTWELARLGVTPDELGPYQLPNYKPGEFTCAKPDEVTGEIDLGKEIGCIPKKT